ncbi:transmembrane protein 218-like [Babylonia areolata]|uniref:transmembrane protein 218-like n=1 Tax=Babylonia areolata TaxID=304850 RepID=UPI003FD2F556
MARVMGVGVGLFLIAFVWAICIFLCLVLTRASTNISKLGPVLILVAGLFTIILVVIPRDPQFPTEDEQAVVYDYSIIYRSVIIAVLSLFILIGLVMYLIKHAMEPVYAKRLRRLRA